LLVLFACRAIVGLLKLGPLSKSDAGLAQLALLAFISRLVLGLHLPHVVSSNHWHWHAARRVALVHWVSLQHLCRLAAKALEELLVIRRVSWQAVVIPLRHDVSNVA